MVQFQARIKTEDNSNLPILEVVYTNPNPNSIWGDLNSNNAFNVNGLNIDEGIIEFFSDMAVDNTKKIVCTKTQNGNQFKLELKVVPNV